MAGNYISRFFGSPKRFSLFVIAIGAVLVLIAVIRGSELLIGFLGGAALHAPRSINTSVMNVVFDFILPFVGGIFLVFSGIYIMGFHERGIESQVREEGVRAMTAHRMGLINRSLSADEKKVLQVLQERGDGTLQSDVVVVTGFSKVKIHRVLKKLENLGLVKRGRFGITNKVYLSFPE